jgi:hypothetical protein
MCAGALLNPLLFDASSFLTADLVTPPKKSFPNFSEKPSFFYPNNPLMLPPSLLLNDSST